MRPSEPLDAVVHLAGETIAQRWTAKAKARIRASRAEGTRLLSEALARLERPPKVMVCASATGYYGHRGDQVLDEQSPPGRGFLAEVCQEWEAAAASVSVKGVRLVHLRLGIVLTSQGGALAKMLPAFRLGLGGPVGDGRQFWSWIAFDDLLAVIRHCLNDEFIAGPVNAVSPEPVSNQAFTRGLAAVLRRPAFLRLPGIAVQILLGEMGRETLLTSARVRPARLEQSGFRFQYPDLEGALRRYLTS